MLFAFSNSSLSRIALFIRSLYSGVATLFCKALRTISSDFTNSIKVNGLSALIILP
jgi:hypothetical protein